MKYNIGDIMYTKKAVQGIPENTQVVIFDRRKKGSDTEIKIKDGKGTATGWVSKICVRKRRR